MNELNKDPLNETIETNEVQTPPKRLWYQHSLRATGQLLLLTLSLSGLGLLWLLIAQPPSPQSTTNTAAQVEPTATVAKPISQTIVTIAPPVERNLAMTNTVETSQTIVFTAKNEQGVGIYQGVLNNKTKQVSNIIKTSFPVSQDIRIYGLYAAPTGKKIAIHWNQANTSYVSILDSSTQEITPLLGEPLGWYQGATFLDWHPDGEHVLVLGFPGSDLDGSAWIVNTQSQEYRSVDIQQKDSHPKITNAIFSPDGRTIAYGQQDCPSCDKNQVWRIDVDGAERRLLFEDSSTAYGIDGLTWSPDGMYIAFVHWQRYPPSGSTGNLYVIDVAKTSQQSLGLVMIDVYNRFQPQWSTDSKNLLFIRKEETEKLATNLYIADVINNSVTQTTDLQDTLLFRGYWQSNSSEIMFLASSKDTDVELIKIPVSDAYFRIHQINETVRIVSKNTIFSSLDNYSILISVK